ncbi:MAG TPA: hypothetical protein VGK59_20440 [Ohtaekwangia sp.]
MTQQSCEILKVGDEKLYIQEEFYPLEFYFSEDTSAAKQWNLTLLSTAENRGYAGKWAVRNHELYLADIFTYRIVRKGFWFWRKTSYPELTVKDLFSDTTEDGIVKAAWFSGRFSSYTKSLKNPVNDRLSLTVENGNITAHQWYHLEGKSMFGGVPYDKPLAKDFLKRDPTIPIIRH